MKKIGLCLLIVLGLFFALGGLIAMKFSLIDFLLNPAGVLGVILLIWAGIIWKRDKKQKAQMGVK